MDDKQLNSLIDSINSLNESVEEFHKYIQDKDKADSTALEETKAESAKQKESESKAYKEQLEAESKINQEYLKKLDEILQENKTMNQNSSNNNNADDFASMGDVLSQINSKVGNIDNQVTNPMGETLQADDVDLNTSYYKVSYLADIVLLFIFFFVLTPYILYTIFVKPFMDAF